MNALNAAERQKIIEDFERLTLADYKQLRTDLAAAKAEIERLNTIIESNIDDGIDKILAMSDEQISALAGYEGRSPDDQATIARQCMDIAMLKTELAARDLVIKQMREAVAEGMEHVEAITCDAEGSVCLLGSDDLRADKYHLQDGIDIIREALALQPTTEALDAYVQRAVEREKERSADICKSIGDAFSENYMGDHASGAWECEAAIRARKSCSAASSRPAHRRR